ncbi:AI-2E family transporter [Oceaniserpentilla sp. 4NH20-0058]|uniref:AI-2E family transporter n=1 Tax=Oceaniserpentilla sp. 4NH20-0058 TaxID=3127660 RepID=UPI0031093CBA
MNNATSLAVRPLIAALVVLVLGWLIYQLEPVLMPFIVGGLLAYLGDPVADRLELKGLSRTWAVVVCFFALTLFFLVLLFILVPLVVHQVKVLYGHVPMVFEWIKHVVQPWLIETFSLQANVFDVDSLKEKIVSQWGGSQDLIGTVLARATSSAGSFINFVVNLTLVPVVGFYLLRDWDILTAKLLGLMPKRYQGTSSRLGRECNEVVGAFLRGQLWVMASLALIYGLGLWMVGLKLALIIALIAGLASIVPYMGFAIGIIAAMLAGYFQFGLDWSLVFILIVFAVGQVIESVVLTPILVGDKIGLHPVAVIFAIMAGGQLFGFVGVILALPVSAVIVVLLRHIHEIYKDTEFYSES